MKTTDGAWMPVDFATDPDGCLVPVMVGAERRVRVVRKGEVLPAGLARLTPHWQTCPDADIWREQRHKSDRRGETAQIRGHGASSTVTAACAGCLRPGHERYGASGGPLCPGCTAVLEAWRALPRAQRRRLIPYQRWVPELDGREPEPGGHGPQRPPGRGHGLDGAPCPQRAGLVQFTPAGRRPAQRLCILCGRVTARRDGDGVAWCGGLLVTGETARPVPVATGGCRTAVTGGVLLAVDGPSLAHRAYHGFERTAMRHNGAPVWALHGFAQLLAKVVAHVRPTAVVVGWDGRGGDSHRRGIEPSYKNAPGRAPRPDDLASQLGAIPQMMADAGFCVVPGGAWEADDVLASAAAQGTRHGFEVVLATSDRDALALVAPGVTVLRLVTGKPGLVRLTPAEVMAEQGVRPDQYADLAALRGDASDNLPGVPGFGAKTAANLLAAVGSVEAALASPEAARAAIGPAAASRLVAGADVWRLNRRLMELNASIPLDLAAAALPGAGRLTEALTSRGVRPDALVAAVRGVVDGLPGSRETSEVMLSTSQ